MEEEEDEAGVEVDGRDYLGETFKTPEIQTKGD